MALTLDCLHLATIEFIRGEGETVQLASYHNRLFVPAPARYRAFAIMNAPWLLQVLPAGETPGTARRSIEQTPGRSARG